MESGGVSALSIDCEDMFKEITKKLYGDEAGVEFGTDERELDVDEQATAWGLAALMQHGVPPPGILQANFTPARPPPGADDRWHAPDEPLAWAHSRVAAYNAAQRLFKCVECDCVGFLARVAEHWLGAHAAARCFHCPVAACGFAAGWARALRQHLQREHHTDAAAADALTRDNPALDDLTRHLARLRARVETKEPPPPPPPDPKRYVCTACPYATDRRDLFTRHENIHRDEKPFHCYLCHKQFNRADHVKKHFLRMHRDHPYDLQRIRRPTSAAPVSTPAPIPTPVSTQMQNPVATVVAPQGQSAYFPKTEVRRGGASGGRRRGERRYSCCYCAWSGVDNWCLKRHLNTHLKPFACALCEYKAARAERLATHVHKVHNKKACSKCPHLADDQLQLAQHLRDAHGTESRGLRVPGRGARGATRGARGARRGPARLFGYMEASDGDEEFDAPEYYPRDKENLPDLRY